MVEEEGGGGGGNKTCKKVIQAIHRDDLEYPPGCQNSSSGNMTFETRGWNLLGRAFNVWFWIICAGVIFFECTVLVVVVFDTLVY